MRTAARSSGLRRGAAWGLAMGEKRGSVVAVVAVLAFLGWRMLPSSAPPVEGEGKAGPVVGGAGDREAAEQESGAGQGHFPFTHPLEDFLYAVPQSPSQADRPLPVGEPGWSANGD